LQKFLEYVASKAIEGLSHEIKEYTIATEVFGRAAAYDPKIDTTVRVQAHRLREKLKEYYDGEGAGEEILLVIPKGHYVPYFSRRSTATVRQPGSPQSLNLLSESPEAAIQVAGSLPAAGATIGHSSQSPKIPYVWLLVGLTAAAMLLGTGLTLALVGSHRTTEEGGRVGVGVASITNPPKPVKDLWGDFLKNDSFPMVAYSNTAFLTTQTSDLLRLKSEEAEDLGAVARSDSAQRLVVNPRLLERAGTVFFNDVYTGTGEVMGVFYLTQMFGQFHSSLGIKRARLVTTDDLTHHDLIFLGSTRENALLEALPLTQDFVFAWRSNSGPWSGRILNLHPRSGESPSYEVERDSQTRAVRADYVLISFLPGLTPDRRIAILGGLTTLGTQAAAEFATSPSQIAEVAARLETGTGTPSWKVPPFFQAVLRVEIMKGDILRVKYVSGHVLHPTLHLSPKN
jgi:hypothetical protein